MTNIHVTAARKLLNWRSEHRSLTVPHDLLEASEMSEALRKHWMVADRDTGLRQINHHMGAINEMEDAANSVVVGDTVTVAENGQSYTGTVASVEPDGSVKLTFQDRKPQTERSYKRGEVNLVGKPKINLPNNQNPVNPKEDSANHGVFRYAMTTSTPTPR